MIIQQKTFMRYLCNAFTIFVFIVFVFGGTAFGQTASRADVEARQSNIAQISSELNTGDLALSEARSRLRELRSDARLAIADFTREQTDIKLRIDNLGAAPTEGQTEPAEIIERRKTLGQELVDVNASVSQARLNAEDAERLLNGLSARQRQTFLSKTLAVEKSVFAPSQWRQIAGSFKTSFAKLPKHIAQWKAARIEAGVWAGDRLRSVGLFLFLSGLLWPFRIWIKRIFVTRLNRDDPQSLGRFIALILHISARIIPAAIALFITYRGGVEAGLILPEYASLARIIIYTVLGVLLTDGLAVGLFNPTSSQRRIIPLQDKSAEAARRLSVVAVLIYGVGACLSQLQAFDVGSTGFYNAARYITSFGVAVLLIIAGRLTRWTVDPARQDDVSLISVKYWTRLRKLSMPIALLIFACLVIGYQNFGYFLAQRSVLLVGVIIWIWTLRRGLMLFLREVDKRFLSRQSDEDATTDTAKTAKSSSREAMMFWAGLFVDIGILFAVIPIAFLMIGTDSYSVRAGLLDAFTGVEIGNFTLSLSDIFAALMTFFVILFVTRFLQRTLDMRLFSKSNTDEGFRNSFRTLLGYAGLIVALFAAIGVVGLDLSSLAIVAGALSLGIGFGLQSIINNFVSGLILLFERPVKVGDWVVTSSGEGIIKQISVRSTEIETFDRASIIVPNSELISSSVKNWTHKNKMGRVIVPIGVAYGTDVKKVREILLEMANENPRILASPPPFVYFKEFGASSLDLELRAFIKDVAMGPVIRNDLRFEILDAFHKADIEIPFPQHDIHIKSSYDQKGK